jgi:hypothetical protein
MSNKIVKNDAEFFLDTSPSDGEEDSPTPQSINPLSGREVSTWNDDEAYENQSFNIGQTVLDLMFTANQTCYTEKILPFDNYQHYKKM